MATKSTVWPYSQLPEKILISIAALTLLQVLYVCYKNNVFFCRVPESLLCLPGHRENSTL